MSRKGANAVIISGGGTGGHVFPAIAIANALKELDPSLQILFVGAKGKLEMEKVPDAGYDIRGLWISGFQRKMSLRNLLFPIKLLFSLVKSFFILISFKPNCAIGVGGYASGPLLYMADKLNIPIVLQEQNSFPGITNRLLAGKARYVFTAYEGLERFFKKEKIILCGNPLRKTISSEFPEQVVCRKYFGIEGEGMVLLVLGGSLGAATINESLAESIDELVANGIKVIWQTGKNYIKIYQRLSDKHQGDVCITAFINEMEKAYGAADIIVSRAGALSISELCIVGKPVILVPSPNVAEDHQRKNARALESRGAAIMVDDADAAALLIEQVLNLADNPNNCRDMAWNIKALAKHQADKVIAKKVLTLIGEG